MMISNFLVMIKFLDIYFFKVKKVKMRYFFELRLFWLGNKERRMLKVVDVKVLKFNVIVVKDGSGNFIIINVVFKVMFVKYKGRY